MLLQRIPGPVCGLAFGGRFGILKIVQAFVTAVEDRACEGLILTAIGGW